jgi:hypothetical protein
LAEQGIEPYQAARAPAERRQRLGQQLGLAGVVAVADDDDAGARMDQPRTRVAIEVGKAFADARAAGPSGGQKVSFPAIARDRDRAAPRRRWSGGYGR